MISSPARTRAPGRQRTSEAASAELDRVDADVNEHVDAVRRRGSRRHVRSSRLRRFRRRRARRRSRRSDRLRCRRRASCRRTPDPAPRRASCTSRRRAPELAESTCLLLPDLDPVERPHWIETRTRKSQAQVMPAGECRQLHLRAISLREARPPRAQRQVACAGVSQPSTWISSSPAAVRASADSYLGGIGANFIVERQRRDRGAQFSGPPPRSTPRLIQHGFMMSTAIGGSAVPAPGSGSSSSPMPSLQSSSSWLLVRASDGCVEATLPDGRDAARTRRRPRRAFAAERQYKRCAIDRREKVGSRPSRV